MTESPSTPRPFQLAADRNVVLCMGPGGVGKTTVAAALGLHAAATGRRVIVVTIDPSRRLAQALGFSNAADPGAIVTVPGTENDAAPLHCLLLDTKRVFDRIVAGYSPNAAAAERMLANPIYQATAERLGGALEYAATVQVHMLVNEGNYDLVVLDTPPTANAIDFLDAPAHISEVLDNPAAKFLAGSARMGTRFLGLASSVLLKVFESLGGGPFVGLLGDFLSDFTAVLGEFRRRAGDVAELLVSPRTGVVVATSANLFSVREADEFVRVLRARGLRVDGLVFNRVEPLPPPIAPDTEGLERLPAQSRRIYDAMIAEVHAAQNAQRAFERAHPWLATRTLTRREQPPTELEQLRALGRELFERSAAPETS